MAFSHEKVVSFFEDAAQVVVDNAVKIAAVLASVFVLSVSVAGYMYYSYRERAQAFTDLHYALKVYDAPVISGDPTPDQEGNLSFSSDEEKWKRLEELARQGLKQHGRLTASSPYNALLAEALLGQGKHDAAIESFDAAVKSVPSEKLKDFYEVKLALLKLDSNNEVFQKEGLAQLTKAADDAHNYAHEVALFYLGYYFWDKKDYMQVKNYWRQLVVKYGLKDAKHQSGFADIAKQKLALISADI